MTPIDGLEEEAVDGEGPYLENASDECEEEVDEDSEIDAMYNEGPDDYELESDREGEETDFEGFSD